MGEAGCAVHRNGRVAGIHPAISRRALMLERDGYRVVDPHLSDLMHIDHQAFFFAADDGYGLDRIITLPPDHES
jgi:hypothetical protein